MILNDFLNKLKLIFFYLLIFETGESIINVIVI